MTPLLAGKSAVITGASRGLGLAIAKARVVLLGRRPKALADVQASLTAYAKQVSVFELDVTARDAAERLVAHMREAVPRWDTLVNSAGAFVYKPLWNVTEADWQQTLDINLTAPFRLTQAFARDVMQTHGQGVVINIGSIHGAVADANAVPQCASKAGLVGLTRAMAEACRPAGVRVNAIAPGAIESESAERLSLSNATRITQADIAQLAAYLASDRARSMTGTIIDAFGLTRPIISSV
jgi:NAD(P)-dependent dehydrogenase (short-subunit alcohol dehydrogenase family)